MGAGQQGCARGLRDQESGKQAETESPGVCPFLETWLLFQTNHCILPASGSLADLAWLQNADAWFLQSLVDSQPLSLRFLASTLFRSH